MSSDVMLGLIRSEFYTLFSVYDIVDICQRIIIYTEFQTTNDKDILNIATPPSIIDIERQ